MLEGRDEVKSAGRIRALALCVVRRDGKLLVLEGYDPTKRQTFYRLLGGGIEFGEYGRQAAAREMREELGAEMIDLRYVGTIENIFIYDGQPGHEIALIFEGAFVDLSLYGRGEMVGHEDDGTPFKVLWKPLSDFGDGHAPLYPEGLLELLAADEASGLERT
jgi:8-oxo-dGTP pyrophosphatase MutT (NUDIX family)